MLRCRVYCTYKGLETHNLSLNDPNRLALATERPLSRRRRSLLYAPPLVPRAVTESVDKLHIASVRIAKSEQAKGTTTERQKRLSSVEARLPTRLLLLQEGRGVFHYSPWAGHLSVLSFFVFGEVKSAMAACFLLRL
jgi:hypothetical protein